MRIGITFDLKSDAPSNDDALPDDFQEEFDAPETIEAIADVLRELGHEVVKLGDGRPMLERLLADPPDFVFNFAEGCGVSRSREARVPAILEMLDIPYSGSDPLTLAVTLDKDCAKRLVASEGVAVPRGIVIGPDDDIGPIKARLQYPAIAKPAWEGSSKGIRAKCLVKAAVDLEEVVESLRHDHRQPILVEEFIEGDELTVGMIGNDPPEIVAVMRVLPKKPSKDFIYSLDVKRAFRQLVDYEVPAKLSAAEMEAVEQAARTSWRVLGCRDVARVDFRLRHGIPYFLEVNPLPGLKPHDSDLVIMGEGAGWTYSQLVERILTAALERQSVGMKASSFLAQGLAN